MWGERILNVFYALLFEVAERNGLVERRHVVVDIAL